MRTHPLVVAIFILAGTACSHFDRSAGSGYSGKDGSPVQISRSKPVVKDPAWDQVQEKTRIKQLENTIRTKKELDQYSKVLPLLRNDQERLSFLQLPDYEARARWMNENAIPSRAQKIQNELREIIEAQDISLGMPQNLVKKSWGEPEHIEVSGNPQFRNERWRYSKYISTPEGYKLERKVVYFEGGKVVGWELE